MTTKLIKLYMNKSDVYNIYNINFFYTRTMLLQVENRKILTNMQTCKGQKDRHLSSFTCSYQRETCLYLSKTPQAFRESKRNCY